MSTPSPSQRQFTEAIAASKGIIFKVIRLYVDDSEDEKDLYQEILFQAWRSYPNFKGESRFSTWLYKVALNTVLTFRRKLKNNIDIDTLTKPPSVDGHRNPDVDALYVAIRSLSEIDRMIVTMHLDGYANEEIADVSGLTKNNVAVKIFRIKEVLANKLK